MKRLLSIFVIATLSLLPFVELANAGEYRLSNNGPSLNFETRPGRVISFIQLDGCGLMSIVYMVRDKRVVEYMSEVTLQVPEGTSAFFSASGNVHGMPSITATCRSGKIVADSPFLPFSFDQK